MESRYGSVAELSVGHKPFRAKAGQSQVESVKTEDGGQMTEKAGLPLDMAVFCLQSSVILTFICVIDSNCVRFHSRSSLLAIALAQRSCGGQVIHCHLLGLSHSAFEGISLSESCVDMLCNPLMDALSRGVFRQEINKMSEYLSVL